MTPSTPMPDTMKGREKPWTFQSAVRWLGKERIEKMLPEPFRLAVSDHSNGCQISIIATMPGHEAMTAWRSSEWYSHIYEFNERGKICGLNPEFSFAKETLDRFFDAVRAEHENSVEAKKIRDEQDVSRAASNRARDLSAYRAAISSNEGTQ